MCSSLERVGQFRSLRGSWRRINMRLIWRRRKRICRRQLFSRLMCRGLHYSNYRNIKTWNRCNGRPARWVEMHKILLIVGSWPIAALMKLMFWTSCSAFFCQLCEVKLKSSINISIWALLISAFWQKDLRNRGKIKSNCLEKPKKDISTVD